MKLLIRRLSFQKEAPGSKRALAPGGSGSHVEWECGYTVESVDYQPNGDAGVTAQRSPRVA